MDGDFLLDNSELCFCETTDLLRSKKGGNLQIHSASPALKGGHFGDDIRISNLGLTKKARSRHFLVGEKKIGDPSKRQR